MSKDDVRKALAAMDDQEVRTHLAGGDFSDVSELDLDDHERQLLRAAADEYPEVAGFAFDAFIKIAGIKGESQDDQHKWAALSPATQKIFTYCATGKHFPEAKL